MPDISKQIHDLDKSISKIHTYFEENGIIPEMHKQVKNTNGRVKKLELWKAYLIGAWCVVSFCSIAVVPTIFYLYVQDVKEDINKAVYTELSEEIEIYLEENFELSE